MVKAKLDKRATRHGLKLFKLEPVVQEIFLLINIQEQKVVGKFPMTAQQVETFLDNLDIQHDTEE